MNTERINTGEMTGIRVTGQFPDCTIRKERGESDKLCTLCNNKVWSVQLLQTGKCCENCARGVLIARGHFKALAKAGFHCPN